MSHIPPDSTPFITPRRADRAVEDVVWLRDFLRRAPVGVLALVDGESPFINNNLFVYDETAHCLYLHTAKQGRTPGIIQAGTGENSGARVCFSVMEMGRLLPAAESLEFSVEFASVMVFGAARILSDQAEAIHGLQLLLDKYAPHLTPGENYRPPVESEVRRTAVIRVDIEAWSGKKKEVAADFPGAYWYDAVTDAAPMLVSLKRRDGG
ncbi:MAG: pyridoxamine 5'-phosphate oxidase family protein [Anaerolineae bacterium]|nr:pyridoxamine 5'-phosphate oxidase family protein [Anaerolineae bacterium]